MQKPSAPPLVNESDVPTIYPNQTNYTNNIPVIYPIQNYYNQGYTTVNHKENQIYHDEIYAKNLHNQINNTITQPPIENRVIVIRKENDNTNNIAKVGCAAALLTFCCMQ